MKDQEYVKSLRKLLGIGLNVVDRQQTIQFLFKIFYSDEIVANTRNPLRSFTKEHLLVWLQKFQRRYIDTVHHEGHHQLILQGISDFQNTYWEKLQEFLTKKHATFLFKQNPFEIIQVGSPKTETVHTLFLKAKEMLLEVLGIYLSQDQSVFRKDKRIRDVATNPYHLELLLAFVFCYSHYQKLWISKNFLLQAILLDPSNSRNFYDRVNHKKDFIVHRSTDIRHPKIPEAYIIDDKYAKKVKKVIDPLNLQWICGVTDDNAFILNEKDQSFYRFEQNTFFSSDETIPSIQKFFCSITVLLCLWFAFEYEEDHDKNLEPIKAMSIFLPNSEFERIESTINDVVQQFGLQDFFTALEWELPSYEKVCYSSVPTTLNIEDLPPPISGFQTPESWITEWNKKWQPVVSEEDSKRWIESRLVLLFNGIRGLSNNYLADTLITVPPLDIAINPFWQSLRNDGRAAVFAESGTGKSRKLLYLAALWKKENLQGEILYCYSSSDMTFKQWSNLGNLLEERIKDVNNKPLLLIFDDLHHKAKENRENFSNLIGDRFKSITWWLGGYTTPSFQEESNYKQIWLSATYQQSIINYRQEWAGIEPFFRVWSHWAVDVTGYNKPTILDWDSINSPWEVGVIIGDLEKRIIEFFKEKNIPKIIYWLFAALFLLYNGNPVPLKEVIHVLKESTKEQKQLLIAILGDEHHWEDSLIDMVKDWVFPKREGIRLLPPQPLEKFSDPLKKIDFLHIRLAFKLWSEIDKEKETLLELLGRSYSGLGHGFDLFKEFGWPITREELVIRLQDTPSLNLDLISIFEPFLLPPTTWGEIIYRFDIEKKSLLKINFTRLSLSHVPPLLRGLQELQELNLKSNQLQQLPIWLGSLCNLKVFDLGGNQLPQLPNSFSNLVELREFSLADNQFQKLPDWLGSFSNLQRLSLGLNQLTQLPDSFGNLTNLYYLNLFSNQLQQLPDSFGNLTSLDSLELSHNQLSQLPKSFGNLINLDLLQLSHNQLTQLPNSFGNLTNLDYLDLSRNQLTQLPESFSNLIRLTTLYLSRNQLQLLPNSFKNLSNLEHLDLSRNQLSQLPESFGNLINLITLDLRRNNLTILPESISELYNLESIDLSYNQMTHLPDCLDHLVLFDLDLSNNQLTQLPQSICGLSNLTSLELSNNLITKLPESFGNLLNLERLGLANNQLSQLPESTGDLSNLKYLDLSMNQLVKFPDSLGDLTNLEWLNLQENSELFPHDREFRNEELKKLQASLNKSKLR